MIEFIKQLSRFPKTVTGVLSALVTGTGIIASPQLSGVIEATHSHEPKQVEYRECVPPVVGDVKLLPAPVAK
jgi:hypothetical protein